MIALILLMSTSVILSFLLLILIFILSTKTSSKVAEDLKRIKRQIEY